MKTGEMSCDWFPCNVKFKNGCYGILAINVFMYDRKQALTLSFCIHWSGGPVDLKSYWPPKKVTGPNIVKKICCYRGAHRFRIPLPCSYVTCFLNVNFSDLENKLDTEAREY